MKNLVFITLAILFSIPSFGQTCIGWGDGLDSIKTRRYYQEYRKLISGHHYEDAVFFWNYVFKKAPSATKNVYLDGVKIYKHFYKTEKEADKKEAYLNKIMAIFDQRAKCLPEDLPNILARKAIELYWLEADVALTHQLFVEALEKGGLKTPSFALVPCAKVAAKAYLEEKITAEQRTEIENAIKNIAHTNIDDGVDTENYYGALVNAEYTLKQADQQVIKNSELAALEDAPKTRCAQITSSYRQQINKEPEDERLITKAINTLKNLECNEANQYMTTLVALQDERLRKQMEGSSIAARSGNTIANANFAFTNGDYEKAVELYQAAITETTDIDKKATYHYQIAKILYAKLDKKAAAKAELLKVLELQPNNGEAYILMGDLYLAGAKECFPKDSFTQKMVIYASIDKWNKAKEVDSSVDAKANQRINKYKNYLPSQSELFLARSRFKGKTYRLGGWINEKVRVNKLK